MTFKILIDYTKKVIYRSVVRSALDDATNLGIDDIFHDQTTKATHTKRSK